jgi:NhaA family Na+:H+ antiporter
VHATIAGVLAATAIPVRRRLGAREFAQRARSLIDTFESEIDGDADRFTTDQSDAVLSLESAAERVGTPLARLEHDLSPFVAYFVMPVFALANAGVALNAGVVSSLVHPLALGIIVGLVIGKQVGVTLFSWLAVRLGFASLPGGATWNQLYGVACLCGIGFTMSLFIANLAFSDPTMLEIAKTGVLAASVISGLWGYALLRR